MSNRGLLPTANEDPQLWSEPPGPGSEPMQGDLETTAVQVRASLNQNFQLRVPQVPDPQNCVCEMVRVVVFFFFLSKH